MVVATTTAIVHADEFSSASHLLGESDGGGGALKTEIEISSRYGPRAAAVNNQPELRETTPGAHTIISPQKMGQSNPQKHRISTS